MRPSPGARPLGAPRPGFRAALAALENTQFRWLFASNIAFFLSMQGQMLVRSMIAYELTGSPLALGMINFAVAIPMMLVSPFGGVIADRLERRRIVITGQGALIASEVTILSLLATGNLELWHLIATAALMGSIFPFTMPARQALVVNVIGKTRLQNAMALSMGGMNATRIIGPAAAGLLVPVVGLTGAFAVGVVLYGVALSCMLGVRPQPPARRLEQASILSDLGEGAGYVRAHRLVFVLLFFGILPMFLAMPFQTLLVVFTEDVWSVGAQGLGVLHAAGGVGGLIGSTYLATRGESMLALRRMMIALVGFSSFLLGFALSPYFLLALPLVLIANACASVFSTLNQTAIQILIPDHVRGRISSFIMMSFGLTPLGTLPMSAVAEAFGAPAAVALASSSVLLVSLLFYAGSPVLRSLDASARDALRAEREAEAVQDAEAEPEAAAAVAAARPTVV